MRVVICALLLAAAARPIQAQVDLSGEWSARYHEDQEHRIPGPELGDYTGLPINDAGRLKADSWDASILSLREHQAKPHPSTYSLRGPANIRITPQFDPVTQETIAYELFGTFGQATRMLWLDGRPHPPAYAPHTWAGFSTARWDGDALTVETTHFKVGWLQRNGVAHSDMATMTEHFMRHGDVLTVVTVVYDPVYLEEPFIRSSNWVLSPAQTVARSQFDVVDEVAGQLVTLAFTGAGLSAAVLAFFVFRALDIVKPYPANRFERLHGGLGIMADDLMAGVYGCVIVHLAMRFAPAYFG